MALARLVTLACSFERTLNSSMETCGATIQDYEFTEGRPSYDQRAAT